MAYCEDITFFYPYPVERETAVAKVYRHHDCFSRHSRLVMRLHGLLRRS
jgi:hypothetical protein